MNKRTGRKAHLWVLILTGSFFGTSLALGAQDLPPAEQPEQSFEFLNNLVEEALRSNPFIQAAQKKVGSLYQEALAGHLTSQPGSQFWFDEFGKSLTLLYDWQRSSFLGFLHVQAEDSLAG